MINKKIILLITLLVFLVGIASASAASDDALNTSDASSKVVKDVPRTTNTVVSNPVEQKNIKKIEKDYKNIKSDGNNIYVSSNGQGNGQSTATPTNMTYALSTIQNNGVINLVTDSEEDTYTESIQINRETVNTATTNFSIIGQADKNIVINSTLKINDMEITIKNINFTGTIGNASIESHNSVLTVDNCTFTHDKVVNLTFNEGTNLRTAYYQISNYVDNSKGAIYNTGDNLVINNCIFQDNLLSVPEIYGVTFTDIDLQIHTYDFRYVLKFNGAAIYNTGNNLKVTNSIFENNTVIESPIFKKSTFVPEKNEICGGAIYNTGNSMLVQNSTFNGNTASVYDANMYFGHYTNGGAIYNTGNSMLVQNNTFNGNTAGNDGGAIYNLGDNVKITNNSFKENEAGYGGAIAGSNILAKLNVENCSFTRNNATYAGAIYTDQCELEVFNSTFSSNTAKENAGAIFTNGAFNSQYNEFINNSAGFRGGALSCYGNTQIGYSNFIDNNAWVGGAIDTDKGKIITVEHCDFINCSAGSQAGAIYAFENELHVDNSIFNGNSAGESGGAILSAKNIIVYYGIFENNWAGTRGGAIYRYDGEYSISYSTFINNTPAEFNYRQLSIYSNTTHDSGIISEGTVVLYSEEKNEYTSARVAKPFGSRDYIVSTDARIDYEPHLSVIFTETQNSFDVKLAPDCYVHNYDELSQVINDNYWKYAEGRTYCISLLPGDYTLTKPIKVPQGLYNGSVIILMGNGQIIDGKGAKSFIELMGGSIITDSLTLMNFRQDIGIMMGSALVINTTFINNTGRHIFSDIYYVLEGTRIDHQPVRIYDSTFINNTGNIMEMDSSTNNVIYGSTFINNCAPEDNGLLYLNNKGEGKIKVSITDSVFIDNTGSIVKNLGGSDVEIEKSIFINNGAAEGGAIYNNDNVNIFDSTFTSNHANYGSAIYSTGNVNIVNCIFSDNQAYMSTIYNPGGTLNIRSSTFRYNHASSLTTIANLQNSFCNVTGSVFDTNYATEYIILSNAGTLIVDNSNFTNNHAPLYSTIGNFNYLNISNCIFRGNTPANFDTFINGIALFNSDGFIPKNAQLNIIIDDTTQTVAMISGTVGDHVIPYAGCTAKVVLNPEDETSFARNLTFIVEENPLPTKFELTRMNDAKVGEKIQFNGKLYETVHNTILGNRNFTLIVNGTEINTTTNNNGSFKFNATYFSAGQKTITVKFAGTPTLKACEESITFTVEPGIANVEVNEVNTRINDVVTLTAHVTECNNIKLSEGEVTFTNNQGETLTTAQVIGGIATTSYTFTKEYYGNIMATFTSDNYQTTTAENVLTVRKINSTMTLTTPTTAYVGDNITINLSVKDENNKPVTGNVTIKIDKEPIETLILKDGEASINTTINVDGEHNITAIYNGNENTTTNTTTNTIQLNKKNTEINTLVISSRADNTTISIIVTDTTNKKQITNAPVKIYENNKEIANTTTPTLKLNLTGGEHTLTIKYEGNNTHNPSETTITVNVTKLNSTITLTVPATAYVGDNITITLNVKNQNNKAVTGNVTIKIDNKTIETLTLNNGQATTNTTINTNGTHNITATYNGNENTNPINNTVPLIIEKHTQSVKVTVDSNGTIMVNVTDEDGTPIPGLEVVIKDETGTTIVNTTTNSKGTLTIPTDLIVGDHNITITTPENDNNKATNNTIPLKVDKIPTTTTITVLNTTAGSVTVTGTIRDKDGRKVNEGTITIKNKTNTIGTTTIRNGQYTVITSIGNKGKYTLTAEYTGTNTYLPSKSQATTINVTAKTPTITTDVTGDKVGKINLKATIKDPDGTPINEVPITVTLPDSSTLTATTDNNGKINIPLNLREGSNNITVKYKGNGTYNPISTKKTITVTKNTPIITLKPVKGVIGESITLTAYLNDEDGTPINGGNLAFKLNGKTLRSDGRFDSSAPAMKFKVENGKVTYNIKADLYLRNAKNLTASYSGTNKYYETTLPSVTAQIQKRYAQVTVTSTPSYAKQYETLTFTVKAKDVTKNGKNNTLIYDNTKVMLKVNGVTLKDAKGKILYLTLDKNAQTTYKYTIPKGTGGITASKKTRDYATTAIFVGDNYYPGARNTTTFQVERSTTTVTITQTKVTKTNVLSVKATLKDYKGNNLIGTNKVTIKINGKSYTKNGKPVYWSVKNGNVDLTSIQVDSKTTIKRVLLVTGERQAYTEGRAETTSITRV